MGELSLGQKMGFSVMFAAGLGNVFADSIGVLTSDYIDRVASRFGKKSKAPKISSAQQKLPQVVRLKTIMSVVGIMTGCLPGLLPLMVMPNLDVLSHDFAATGSEPAAEQQES